MKQLLLALAVLLGSSSVALAQGGNDPTYMSQLFLQKSGDAMQGPLGIASHTAMSAPACTVKRANHLIVIDGSLQICESLTWNDVGGGGGSFAALTSGTNNTSTMVCGLGCTLGPGSGSGTGSITATAMDFSGLGSGFNTNALTIESGGSLGVGGSGAIAATSAPFSGITAGTSAQAFVIGSSGSLGAGGSGTVTATAVPVTGITGTTGTPSSSTYLRGDYAWSTISTTPAFSSITSATNTGAAMVVGTGASLGAGGSGTIAATAAPFSGISAGTNTAALVVGSSGTLGAAGSGTITATAVPASGITGTTLASGVFTSSLTAVGTLVNLTVTNPITGSITGDAGTLLTKTWASPAAIGSGTPAAVTGTIVTATANGAASTPPLTETGTWFTNGSATTTKPQLLVEPTGTTSTGWSTAGTGVGVNAATGFSGSLLDLQLAGASSARFVAGLGGTSNDALFFPRAATTANIGAVGVMNLLSYANFTSLGSSAAIQVGQYGLNFQITNDGTSNGGGFSFSFPSTNRIFSSGENIQYLVNFDNATQFYWPGAVAMQRMMVVRPPGAAGLGITVPNGSAMTTGVTMAVEGAPSPRSSFGWIANPIAFQVGGVSHQLTTGNSGLFYRALDVLAHTVTLDGSTNLTATNTGGAAVFGQVTYSAASALTISNAATVDIVGPPIGGGAGPATITNPYALLVRTGAAYFGGKVISAQATAPTATLTSTTLNDGAGSGATITVAAGSTDTAGSFTITAGNGVPGAGIAGQIVFNAAYASAPKVCQVQATTTGGTARLAFVSALATWSFTVSVDVAFVSSSAHSFSYVCLG